MTRSWKLACSGLIFCCYDGVIMVTIKAKNMELYTSNTEQDTRREKRKIEEGYQFQ